MRIAVTGSNSEDVKDLKKRLKESGHEIVKTHPEMVISFGGDGSYLYSEMKYPGVPKLITRNKSICIKCENSDLNKILIKLKQKKFTVEEHTKLDVTATISGKEKTLTATSDVTIRNLEQYHAIRFCLHIDGKQMEKEIIGDGIVVANTFGSTGYFKAITKKSFSKGIGIALNNTNTSADSILLNNSEINFSLKRNTAGLTVDNHKRVLKLKPGDQVKISLGIHKARIIKLS